MNELPETLTLCEAHTTIRRLISGWRMHPMNEPDDQRPWRCDNEF